jgi:hypothetical protein
MGLLESAGDVDRPGQGEVVHDVALDRAVPTELQQDRLGGILVVLAQGVEGPQLLAELVEDVGCRRGCRFGERGCGGDWMLGPGDLVAS